MEKRIYDTPLSVLLWILIILVVFDFVGRVLLFGVLFSSGIFDKFLVMLGF